MLTDDTRTEIPVVADDVDELRVRLLASAVGINENRQRLSDADGVGELDKATAGKATSDEGLGDPASSVSRRAIDLGEVLAGEGATTVGTPATIGVDDDFTASQAGITLRTTDNEAS